MQLKAFNSGVGMAVSVLSTIGASVLMLSQPTLAQQQTSINPLQDFNSRNSDSDSSVGIDQGTMFDLLHKAQQGFFDVNPTTVLTEQRQGIQDAAAEFRAKQRQLMQQPSTNVAEDAMPSENIEVER